MRLKEYVDPRGDSPFRAWFDNLPVQAAARVASSLARLEQGNTSNVKSVGGGVVELRMDFGPGYRVYFGRQGDRLVILLAGGTKRRQSEDIALAKVRWTDFKARTKEV